MKAWYDNEQARDNYFKNKKSVAELIEEDRRKRNAGSRTAKT